MKQLLGLALAATTVLAAPALAAPEHVRVRGTVTAVSSDMMKVKTSAGDEQTVMLDGNTHYLAVVKSSLDHIEKDSFIGTATKSVGDRMIALEVVIFPPAMKGAGEGHYGWDKIPDTTLAGGASTSSTMTNGTVATVRPSGGAPAVNSTMTNGTVASAATRGSAKTLTVTYKGGEQTILVPPTAPIVSFRPGTMAEVKDGDTVFVNATEDGGKITANAVAVGTDGVKPPM
jgi:hypothetical protein